MALVKLIEKVAESAIPGGPLIVEALKHPYRSATALGSVAFLAINIPIGIRQGLFDVGIETEVTAVDQGRGTIVDIDLEIPERPMIGYTADVEGLKLVLSKEFGGELGPFTLPTFNLGENSLTLANRVDTTICYDPSLITAQYDPGMISDKEDDQIILNVPLEAMCVSTDIDPTHEVSDFDGDIFSLPANYVTAFTDSFNFLEKVPGIGAVDDNKNKMEQSLLGIGRVQMLSNVGRFCTQEVMKDATVNEAVHKNFENAVIEVIAQTDDPALQDLTLGELQEMDVAVYMGSESAAQPVVLDQEYVFTDEYADEITKFEEDPNIQFESEGEFECEISDEVKEMLDQQNTSTAAPTSSPEATDE